jgi:hypothetical protein
MIKNTEYKIPKNLNDFQRELYIHLINWKWKNITNKVGIFNKIEYDAFLPKESYTNDYPHIYNQIETKFKEHQKNFPFKLHPFFFHMASSQAANANLFLPILLYQYPEKILNQLNKNINIKRIANEYLDNGFKIEFWGGEGKGFLNDHTDAAGTDADIAIAYYNEKEELCLWMIEHKLTEIEFTTCGGYKSKGNKNKANCSNNFSEILKDKDLCYYHKRSKYFYWDITEQNKDFFPNHNLFSECPFKNGLNQLWRNQLLGLSIEDSNTYKNVYFSVVRHPENTSLDNSINKYKELTNNNPKFSVFTSRDVLNATEAVNDSELNKWIKWYKELYNI